MTNKYINEILSEYEKTLSLNREIQRFRQAEIYSKLPKIKEIDDLISSMGFEIAASIFKDIDMQSFIVEQKKRITDLKIQKSEILSQNKYPVDYLELKYECYKCKDTAYIGNVKCNCFKQKLIDRYYLQSNLRDIIKKENFDTFNMGFYSDSKIGPEKISPYKNIQEIFTYCSTYAKDFDSSKENLLFSGSSGLGKTFLSNCIAKDLLDTGKVVIYQTSANLIDIIRKSKFDDSKDSDLPNEIMNCDLLIIDDLGTENNNSFTQSELFNIINTRILNRKKMIISTNYSLDEIYSVYPQRIASRLFGEFKGFKFFGDDIRLIKKTK
jgi:DNA replication protein DnaC